MWNTYPIASAIRQGKTESIDNYLLTGRDEGMVSFDESVRLLLEAGKISRGGGGAERPRPDHDPAVMRPPARRLTSPVIRFRRKSSIPCKRGDYFRPPVHNKTFVGRASRARGRR